LHDPFDEFGDHGDATNMGEEGVKGIQGKEERSWKKKSGKANSIRHEHHGREWTTRNICNYPHEMEPIGVDGGGKLNPLFS